MHDLHAIDPLDKREYNKNVYSSVCGVSDEAGENPEYALIVRNGSDREEIKNETEEKNGAALCSLCSGGCPFGLQKQVTSGSEESHEDHGMDVL